MQRLGYWSPVIGAQTSEEALPETMPVFCAEKEACVQGGLTRERGREGERSLEGRERDMEMKEKRDRKVLVSQVWWPVILYVRQCIE